MRDSGKERKLPEYSWDYCFPGDELGFKWTILVGKERGTKGWMAAAVPQKGISTGRYTTDKCLELIEENRVAKETSLSRQTRNQRFNISSRIWWKPVP